jgi:hypothetical protein
LKNKISGNEEFFAVLKSDTEAGKIFRCPDAGSKQGHAICPVLVESGLPHAI